MYTVQVLLSTYNGETYLKEQLDSILNQKNVAVKLFVRDDGSSDGNPNGDPDAASTTTPTSSREADSSTARTSW